MKEILWSTQFLPSFFLRLHIASKVLVVRHNSRFDYCVCGFPCVSLIYTSLDLVKYTGYVVKIWAKFINYYGSYGCVHAVGPRTQTATGHSPEWTRSCSRNLDALQTSCGQCRHLCNFSYIERFSWSETVVVAEDPADWCRTSWPGSNSHSFSSPSLQGYVHRV